MHLKDFRIWNYEDYMKELEMQGNQEQTEIVTHKKYFTIATLSLEIVYVLKLSYLYSLTCRVLKKQSFKVLNVWKRNNSDSLFGQTVHAAHAHISGCILVDYLYPCKLQTLTLLESKPNKDNSIWFRYMETSWSKSDLNLGKGRWGFWFRTLRCFASKTNLLKYFKSGHVWFTHNLFIELGKAKLN